MSAEARRAAGSSRRARRGAGAEQLELPAPRTWGGRRVGAGRPRKPGGAVPHTQRPALAARFPVHVVVRVAPAVRGLRRRACYHAIRRAVMRCATRGDFRIVHLSIQQSHLHLLVEAASKQALSRGMQGFEISAAKLLNRAIGVGRPSDRASAHHAPPPRSARRGAVFPTRYHATVLRTPTQTRHALSYVLNNWRKHWAQIPVRQRALWIDPFSSSYAFTAWAEYRGAVFLWPMPPTYEPLLVHQPRTWLLRAGYLRGGPAISLQETPGRAP